MKNWKRFVVGLTGALLVLTTGCGQEQTDPAPDEVPYVTVPPVIDVDVSQLLTTEEVASALGVESVSVQMYEEGLWAHYATEDGLTTADIHIDKCERSMFDLILSQYANLQEAPNLGDVAQWSPETKELLAYGRGYSMVVVSDIPSAQEDTLLVASRQIAACLLERLPA